MGLSNERIEMLRQVLPEQMERDPSGALADLTLRAIQASEGAPARIHYLHEGRCGGLAALAGSVKEGGHTRTWFVAPMTRFQRVPDGRRVVDLDELRRAIDAGTVGGTAGRVLMDLLASGSAIRVTADDDGSWQIEPADAGTTVDAKGRGWEIPDGHLALVAEPEGFPPAPATFPIRCEKCRQGGTLERARVAADLRHAGKRSRVRVPLAESK